MISGDFFVDEIEDEENNEEDDERSIDERSLRNENPDNKLGYLDIH